MTAERTASDAAGMSPTAFRAHAASLSLPERQRFWVATLQQAAAMAPEVNPDLSWDGLVRTLIETESAAVQDLLQGPAELAEPTDEEGDGREACFDAGMLLLRGCEGWIEALPDAERREPLHQCLAFQLALLVGRLHQWLVIEEAQGGERAEWFWRGWQVLQWRGQHTEALPAWWEPVQEQLARYGALEWLKRTKDCDPASEEGQQAIRRALTLLESLCRLHEPVPTWMKQAQIETLKRLTMAGIPPYALHGKLFDLAFRNLDLLKPARQEPSNTTETGQVWQALHDLLTAFANWESLRSQAEAAMQGGDWKMARVQVHEWASSRSCWRPTGVDEQTWSELLLNACSNVNRNTPNLWLVESRSLPRSGHHYLKSVLKRAWGEQFSYCEGYQEPGCCQTSPCRVSAYWNFAREHHGPHLRLLKSHDFKLSDATFDPPPGMIRLIQVRRPFDLLASWLELEQLTLNQDILKGASIVLERVFLYHEPEVLEEAWRIIDEAGTVMSSHQVQEWLAEKVGYVVGFLHKWLPLVKPTSLNQPLSRGNILLRYEDLGRCHQLLQALGRDDIDVDQVPDYSPPHRQVLKRSATRVTEMMEKDRMLLSQADAQVIADVPAMAELYPAALR